MQGYTYKYVGNAWVCQKCSALVEDPNVHEDSHLELVRVLSAWSQLLDRAAEGDVPDVPDHHGDEPADVPDGAAGGPGDRAGQEMAGASTGAPAWAPEVGERSGGSH